MTLDLKCYEAMSATPYHLHCDLSVILERPEQNGKDPGFERLYLQVSGLRFLPLNKNQKNRKEHLVNEKIKFNYF